MKYNIEPLKIISTVLKQIFSEGYKSVISLAPEHVIELALEKEPRLHKHTEEFAKVSQSLLVGVAFLQSKLPVKPKSLQADFFGEEWVPAKSDVSRFNEYLSAAIHPEKILKDLKNMVATKIEIQVCKVIYSSEGGEVIQTILERVQGKKIPYSQKLWLSNLSDAGLLNSTNGQFIIGIQSTFDVNNPAPATQSPERSKGPRKRTPQQMASMVASDATDLQKDVD
jgi:hypothetical protein